MKQSTFENIFPSAPASTTKLSKYIKPYIASVISRSPTNEENTKFSRRIIAHRNRMSDVPIASEVKPKSIFQNRSNSQTMIADYNFKQLFGQSQKANPVVHQSTVTSVI